MFETYVINSVDEFHKYFKLLKDCATRGDKQKIFHVGLDTEFICKDNHGESFKNSINWVENNTDTCISVCVLQLYSCSENSDIGICFVINLVKMGKPLPKNLIKILKSKSWIKTGVSVENDLEYLSLNYNLGNCSGGIDLDALAIMSNYNSTSLENLYNLLFTNSNININKKHQFFDWSQELTDDKIEYASLDALMSFELGKLFFNPIKDLLSLEVVNHKIVNSQPVNLIKSFDRNDQHINYIGKIQEYAQRNELTLPNYKITYEDNKKHPKLFTYECFFVGKFTSSTCTSKKKSKNESARKMFKLIKDF